MARLTLVIDDDLLHRARTRALAQGTTVNTVVRETLASYADDGRVLEGRRRVAALARSSIAVHAFNTSEPTKRAREPRFGG